MHVYHSSRIPRYEVPAQYRREACKHDDVNVPAFHQLKRPPFEFLRMLFIIGNVSILYSGKFCPFKRVCILLVGDNERDLAAFDNSTALVQQRLKVCPSAGYEHRRAWGQHIVTPSPETTSPMI